MDPHGLSVFMPLTHDEEWPVCKQIHMELDAHENCDLSPEEHLIEVKRGQCLVIHACALHCGRKNASDAWRERTTVRECGRRSKTKAAGNAGVS